MYPLANCIKSVNLFGEYCCPTIKSVHEHGMPQWFTFSPHLTWPFSAFARTTLLKFSSPVTSCWVLLTLLRAPLDLTEDSKLSCSFNPFLCLILLNLVVSQGSIFYPFQFSLFFLFPSMLILPTAMPRLVVPTLCLGPVFSPDSRSSFPTVTWHLHLDISEPSQSQSQSIHQ